MNPTELDRLARLVGLPTPEPWQRDVVIPNRNHARNVLARRRPAPRTLTADEYAHALALCSSAAGASQGSVAGHYLGQLRDLLAPAVGLGHTAIEGSECPECAHVGPALCHTHSPAVNGEPT